MTTAQLEKEVKEVISYLEGTGIKLEKIQSGHEFIFPEGYRSGYINAEYLKDSLDEYLDCGVVLACPVKIKQHNPIIYIVAKAAKGKSYREVQKALKQIREVYGFKVAVKLNASLAVLNQEIERILEIA